MDVIKLDILWPSRWFSRGKRLGIPASPPSKMNSNAAIKFLSSTNGTIKKCKFKLDKLIRSLAVEPAAFTVQWRDNDVDYAQRAVSAMWRFWLFGFRQIQSRKFAALNDRLEGRRAAPSAEEREHKKYHFCRIIKIILSLGSRFFWRGAFLLPRASFSPAEQHY